MKAKVTEDFPGVPDGEVHPRTIRKGETVTGELARIAVEGGLADEVKETAPKAKK